jgi:clan AA aspartic protease
MGYTFAEITLRNALDGWESELMEEPKNRQKTVQALVDTGAHWLVVSEELRRELGLKIVGEKRVSLADNTKIICPRTGLVEIHWKDRCAVQSALVVPERPNVLLGVWPLEEMDLIVDPVRQELKGRHGDDWIMYI